MIDRDSERVTPWNGRDAAGCGSNAGSCGSFEAAAEAADSAHGVGLSAAVAFLQQYEAGDWGSAPGRWG